jgi:hypothetical protein
MRPITRLCAIGAIAWLSAACSRDQDYQPQVPGANPEQGRIALQEHECGVCHIIPGVRGARGRVGPPLDAYSRRVYVAGKFPNTPQVLVRWIQDAPSLAPRTAMPAIAMPEAQARNMAAYLYTLD